MSPFVVLLLTFFVAMCPVVELKLAIPLGMGLARTAVSPWAYFAAAYVGSCVPALLILLFLRPMLRGLGRTRLFAPLAVRLDAHFAARAERVRERAKKRADRVAEKSAARAAAKGETQTEAQALAVAEAAERRRARTLTALKYLALFLFVAIPLPLTGVWTGSAIGTFLDTKTRYAFPCVALGNLVAGLAVMFLSLAGYRLAGITIPLA